MYSRDWRPTSLAGGMLMLYVLTMVTRLRRSAYNDLATADDVRRIRSIQYGVSKLKWTNVAGSALILYPFIAGRAGMERGLSDQQWVAFGTIVAQIHATPLSPRLLQTMRRESYAPAGADVVRRLDAHISTQTFDDPAARAFAACWQSRREDIRTLVGRAEGCGRRLARKGLLLRRITASAVALAIPVGPGEAT